jgi:hypothetical protein
VKRNKITEQQLDEIDRILNDILPEQSGRNYKYQEQTDKAVYQAYTTEVLQGKPVSKAFLSTKY